MFSSNRKNIQTSYEYETRSADHQNKGREGGEKIPTSLRPAWILNA